MQTSVKRFMIGEVSWLLKTKLIWNGIMRLYVEVVIGMEWSGDCVSEKKVVLICECAS